MSFGHGNINNAIPGEYRKATERLFPKEGFSKGQKPDLKTAGEFAKALGIAADYQRLLALNKNSAELRSFIEQFQNNLDLLIKKTWVEKSDERYKTMLHEKIPPFLTSMEQGDLQEAIEVFGVILEELAYLFFGVQSGKEDFTEYTFRIDAQMGLFWWYGGRLASLKELSKDVNVDDKVLWAILLLGICYLTNF